MQESALQEMSENEAGHWWFRARRAIISQLIARLIGLKRQVRLLEVGCGTGGNLSMLREFGQLEAIEPNDFARSYASRLSGLRIESGGLPGDLPVPDNTYDIVGLFDVLEHVENDLDALLAVNRKLSADGHLVITVPAYQWLWSNHDQTHHHYRRYTIARLKRVIQQADLEIEQIGYFNTLLFPIAALQRLLVRMCRRPLATDGNVPAWLNAVLFRVFATERHLISRLPMPFGLSVFAVARKRR
ncbi:class I SAM-dependent methyltransferase [Salinisphaera sp. P385]|uniref:Class I SAM-dependent methyltransferase n=1 Tax=Spectribacter acetivorans TaxID=3075603 RepID=A0ABU3BBG4_9GAMM|nr:class I SAM-dependent methyltransferase [Salinisphaera sp. P385]MDT0619795.1 class I SAM-dependent methyltransferase [Salinisphaera sp. P385]